MVASPSGLATTAGVNVLRNGGNAVDAIIAANAVLAVVSPAMCGLGGDALWLVYEPKRDESIAYNGSGRAPRAANAAALRAQGLERIPWRDARAVTVPGAVRSWEDVLAAHGTRSLDELLAPAERYATDGYAQTDVNAGFLALNDTVLRRDVYADAMFLRNGAYRSGAVVRNPDLAVTLAAIRRGGADAFYRGAVAERIVSTLQRGGQPMTLDDLAAHRTEITKPLRMPWRDLELLAFPPNSQGVTALLALGAVAGDPVEDEYRWQHLAIEAIKRAFEYRDTFFGDPQFVDAALDELLRPSALRAMRESIGERALPEVTRADPGDTVYLCAVDGEGRCVSLVQSLYMNFGSGIVADGTGVFLHNRGAYFRLTEGHPNELAGGKRPVHTLSPGMALRDGKPAIVYGTMGSDGQPQNQVQILHNYIDRGMSIQQSIDAPRWLYGRVNVDETTEALRVESRADPQLVETLRARGHDVQLVDPFAHEMGHAHAIAINRERGTLAGGADPRTDSLALGI